MKRPNPTRPNKIALDCFYCKKPQILIEKVLGFFRQVKLRRNGQPKHRIVGDVTMVRAIGPIVPKVGSPRFICAKHATKKNREMMFDR